MLKLLSVLLVLCMMLSMLPVTAFAKPDGPGAGGPGQQPGHGEVKPCDHKHTEAIPNEDGLTHDIICKNETCKQVVTDNEPHDYKKDGKCKCGAVTVKPCEHKQKEAIPNEDGLTHDIICKNETCKQVVTDNEPHDYKKDGKCMCGAVKPDNDDQVDMDHFKDGTVVYIDNKDGTHTPVYTCKNDANHKYNGKAVAHEFENCECVCGAEKTFTITYYASGKVYQVDTYKAGDEIVLPANPTQADEGCKTYTFAGWNVTIPKTMPAEDLWFTAIFEVNEKHTFEDGKCGCGAEDPDYEEPSVPSVPSTPVVPSVPSTPIKPAFPNWGNIFDKWFGGCDKDEPEVDEPEGDEPEVEKPEEEKPEEEKPSVPSVPLVPSTPNKPCTPVKPSNPIKPVIPGFGWIIKAVVAWLK